MNHKNCLIYTVQDKDGNRYLVTGNPGETCEAILDRASSFYGAEINAIQFNETIHINHETN